MQIQSAIRAQLIPIWMGIINKSSKNTGGEGLGQKQSLEGDDEMKLVSLDTEQDAGAFKGKHEKPMIQKSHT